MTASADDPLLPLVRMGWTLAEARGRYRLWNNPRLVPAAGLPSRAEHALPLADERSPYEQRIEIRQVLGKLAGDNDLDFDCVLLTGQVDFKGQPASLRLEVLDRHLEIARDPTRAHPDEVASPVDEAWDDLALFLYGWDAHIQDVLSAKSYGMASAYQLGRSLAEMYWALDPTANAAEATSWQSVLGPHRRDEVGQLLARLGAHFDHRSVEAIKFSVGRWCVLADDPTWRSEPSVLVVLSEQARLWRDLLLTARDPSTLVDPRSFLKRAGQIRGLIGAFVPELGALALALVALLGAGYLFSGKNNGGLASGLLGALGAFGITGAGIAAKAKSAAQGVQNRLSAVVEQDVINAAVTLCPERNNPKRAATTAPSGEPTIEHIVVLALENRSFDHLLGFLDHPDPTFDGLCRPGVFVNPGWPGMPDVTANPDAKGVLPVDPDHSHDAVMEQLALAGPTKDRRPTNRGFVTAYERKGRGLARPQLGGLVGIILTWWTRNHPPPPAITGRGPLAMACQYPDQVPVLSRLAKEFGCCTRWFCSVPGETWPNRNFLHAATSAGDTDIEPRWYTDRTIFELLEDHHKTWRIYHDDTPQVWAFRRLWDTPERQANWFEFPMFKTHVAQNQLPTYSFIEPNHRPPFHTLDHAPIIGKPDVSNSQHPGNNLVSNDAYDAYPQSAPGDFVRAETLVADVYETLRSNIDLFNRTILLVTYDEHGGLYDHVPPPTGIPSPRRRRGLLARAFGVIYHRKSKHFDFTMLGPRVPALVISPLVPPGTISTETRDHASVPATLRKLFAPTAEPLTRRDAWAFPFDSLLTLRKPRPPEQLPDLSILPGPGSPPAEPAAQREDPVTAATVPAHYEDFANLATKVERRLRRRRNLPREAVPVEAVERPQAISRVFADEAHRLRNDNSNTLNARRS